MDANRTRDEQVVAGLPKRVVDEVNAGAESLLSEHVQGTRPTMSRPPVDSVGVDIKEEICQAHMAGQIEAGWPEPSWSGAHTYYTLKVAPRIIGPAEIDVAHEALESALTAPADGKPCKTCGGSRVIEVPCGFSAPDNEECPDCTPSTEEDT